MASSPDWQEAVNLTVLRVWENGVSLRAVVNASKCTVKCPEENLNRNILYTSLDPIDALIWYYTETVQHLCQRELIKKPTFQMPFYICLLPCLHQRQPASKHTGLTGWPAFNPPASWFTIRTALNHKCQSYYIVLP